MPTITPADALIKAADNLEDAISGVIPKDSITEDVILQLMAIYCKQALDVSNAESAQRVLRRLAETQRMHTEQEIAINEQNSDEQRVPTVDVDMPPDLGIFEFEQQAAAIPWKCAMQCIIPISSHHSSHMTTVTHHHPRTHVSVAKEPSHKTTCYI